METREFFLTQAKDFLNALKPENRKILGNFYLCSPTSEMYAVTFKFTDKWEVATCIKWLNQCRIGNLIIRQVISNLTM